MLSGDFVLGFLWDAVVLGFISMLTLGWCGTTNLLMLCCHRFCGVLLQSFFCDVLLMHSGIVMFLHTF